MVAYQTKPPDFGGWREVHLPPPRRGGRRKRSSLRGPPELLKKAGPDGGTASGSVRGTSILSHRYFTPNPERKSTDRMTVFGPEICGRLTKPLIYKRISGRERTTWSRRGISQEGDVLTGWATPVSGSTRYSGGGGWVRDIYSPRKTKRDRERTRRMQLKRKSRICVIRPTPGGSFAA